MSLKNLPADIQTYDFKVVFGVPSLSSDKQKVEIPYTGIADAALTADIVVYDYSTDNGSTWEQMTPSSGTTLTGLSFTASGSSFQFDWEAKADLGLSLYNQTLRIRLQAESGGILSNLGLYQVYFERSVSDPSLDQENVPFPEDYKGVPGEQLLTNAPRPS